ncbi:MAG: right-handed parallel beta-helix repeat-containing protein [Chthoniobacteraceae bacterium]
MRWSKLISLFAALVAQAALAAEYYVATKGNDANPGTLAAPWKTIQKAADTLQPGDTVFVRRGVYKGLVTINVSGAPGLPITFTNYSNEKPVIDGSGIVPPEEDRALIFIQDRSYLVVRGFEVRNFSTAKPNLQPSGIFVTGASHDIELRNNNVHAIRNTHKDGNAFGIAIYGTSAAQAVTGLVIEGNEVHHLKTGNSESMVLNGNVTGFAVTNNRVHDNNNIGIDFAGFEETVADPLLDRARDGVCRGNVVWNISSRSNPSYHGAASADGIYCDGAKNVLIERNLIYLCDIGVELASEHAGGNSDGCILRDNFISRCRVTGLGLGGYDALRGSTMNCTVTNNTFYQNDTLRTGSGEVMLQFYLTNNTLKQNVLFAGAQNVFVSNPAASNASTVFDYNCYFAKGGAADSEWQWKEVGAIGFEAWKMSTGQDGHSIFADPKFVKPTVGNFRLKLDSPAVNAGDPAFLPAVDEFDIGGAARVTGARVDIGADEFVP